MLRGPLDTPVYRFLRVWVPWVLGPLYRIRVRGIENVPATGAVVLASNHLSNIDPIFLGAMAPRQIHFMAKAELWKVKPLGRLIASVGSFPVRRGEADREAVRRALEVLGEGAVLGIFPEGHRQKDGTLGEPQPGFALFSLRPGVVTIPVALTGTNRILGKRKLPRFPRVTISFGPPLSREVQGATKADAHRLMAARWRAALTALLAEVEVGR